jgi:hypothetical protein
MVPNPLFRRMTPTQPVEVVLWAVASVLMGLTLAARSLPKAVACTSEGRIATSGILTYLAAGCPICNKVVVALLGVSGALTYFAPLQPLLGLAAVVLLATTLKRSLVAASEQSRGRDACPALDSPPVSPRPGATSSAAPVPSSKR